MLIRSWLFIPGDNDRKLAKADGCGADAVVLDLEDSVASGNRDVARKKIRAFLDARPMAARKYQVWVRTNALDDTAIEDLCAVVGGAPDGIMLPKIDGPEDVVQLAHYLDVMEEREAVARGHIKIVPVSTETPTAALSLPAFAKARIPRLLGLNWGAEDLSAAIGAKSNVDANGQWSLTYRWLRSSVLLAAKAAGVQAIDTVYVDYRDIAGFKVACRASAQEGFTGRVAIHPDQVAPINEAFTPSEEDVALARQIVAAFDGKEGIGTIGIGGKMFDIPHLKRAHRLLELHEYYSQRN